MSDVHVEQTLAAITTMVAIENALLSVPSTIVNAWVGKGDSLYSALRLMKSEK